MNKALVLIKIALISTILPPSRSSAVPCNSVCPKNEILSTSGSRCQITCWNRKLNQTSSCAVSTRCICRSGFVRHPDTYECIQIKSCPVQTNHVDCPKNEIYTVCSSATMECDRKCGQLENVSKNCTCRSQCMCKRGFARSSVTSQCIPISACEKCPAGFAYDRAQKRCSLECSDTCPTKNQTFTQCGSSCRELKCPLSSDERDSMICSQECKTGCFCSNGYRRDLVTNKCVLSHDCSPPAECPENETFKCGNPLCEPTCETVDKKCTKVPARCESRCYCNKDYIRPVAGSQCVNKKQCPIINFNAKT